ncbi:MAG: serine hydrolase [Acidobacteria bacterium]|nr:serine hydrolase [Acidobacteriota bacterium]
MNWRKRIFWRALSFLIFLNTVQAQVLTPGKPEEVGMSSERLARLDEVVQEAITQGETPGAVVLVARKGKIVYRNALGYRSLVPAQEPMTVDTIFDIASLTKVIATAPSILILVEEGKVSLTDQVSTYLPGFAANGKGSITLLQLLTHYSGLRPDLDLDEPWEGYETAIEKAFQEQLILPPGEEFVYSDINYIVLAELVRQVSGKPLHEFSWERIFSPLGMIKTRFLPPPEFRNLIAPTDFRDGQMLRGVVHDPTTARMGGSTGHAGLFSTVDETAIYAQMILNQGLYNGVRILSPLSIIKMTTPQSPIGATNWRGIGFDIRTPFSGPRGDLFSVGSFGHTGFTGTSLWIDPSHQVFVILFTNRVHPDGMGSVISLRKKVASVVAASIMDVPLVRE